VYTVQGNGCNCDSAQRNKKGDASNAVNLNKKILNQKVKPKILIPTERLKGKKEKTSIQ
jgi:hypothetical protein